MTALAETEGLPTMEDLPDFEALPPHGLEEWFADAAVAEAEGRPGLLIGTIEALPADSPHFETIVNIVLSPSVPLTDQLDALCAFSRSRYSDPAAAYEMGLDIAGSVSMQHARTHGGVRSAEPFVRLAAGQTSPRHLDLLQGRMTGETPEIAGPVLVAMGKARLDAGETDVSRLVSDRRLTAQQREELLVHQVAVHAKAGRIDEARAAVEHVRLSRGSDLLAELHITAAQRKEYPNWEIIEDELLDPHGLDVQTRLKAIDLLLASERSDLAVDLAESIPLYDGTAPVPGDEYKDAILVIAKHQALQGDTFAAAETLDAATRAININMAHAAQQLGRHSFRSNPGKAARARLQFSHGALDDINRMRGRILALTEPYKMVEALQLIVPPEHQGAYGDFLLARTLVPDLAAAGRIREAAGLVARVSNRHSSNKSEWYAGLAKATRHHRQRELLVYTATSSQVEA